MDSRLAIRIKVRSASIIVCLACAAKGAAQEALVHEGRQLEVLEFLDKPGLDDGFRVWPLCVSRRAPPR